MGSWFCDPDEELEKLLEASMRKTARWTMVAAAVAATFAGLCVAAWTVLSG